MSNKYSLFHAKHDLPGTTHCLNVIVQHEQGQVCYFGEKLHFRDSGIDEISGSGSGLKSCRDPGIPIPGLQSLAITSTCQTPLLTQLRFSM